MAQPKKTEKKKKIAIALQGGGSHGTFSWGVLDALLEHDNIEIIGLSGTSAGAMNAASLLQGYIKNGAQGAREELERFWRLMAEKSQSSGMKPTPGNMLIGDYSVRGSPLYESMNMLSTFFSPYQLNPFDMNPLRDFVRDFFDFKLMNKAKSPQIFLCATHVKTGKLKLFEGPELKEESLLASACLPTMFKAVEVDGEYYWDGGFIGNPAIYPLIYNTDATDIVVIQLRQAYRAELPTTADAIADRHKEITFNSCLLREMRAIYFVTKLIDKGVITDPSIRRLNMHLIRNPEVAGQIDMSSALNTDIGFFEYMFKEGRKTGKEWLKDNYQHIGVRTSAEIEKDFI